jgi:hypothetical protein
MRQLRRYTTKTPITLEGSNKPHFSTKLASRPTAKEVLDQSLGQYKVFYPVLELSETLEIVFGKGWKKTTIHEYQKKYWILGIHYIRNGRCVSFHLENIVQWHLDRQG